MTSYDSIRDIFLSKITSYDFGKMIEADANAIIDKYLKSATVKFKYCTQNLNDRDDNLRQFNIDLTNEEQEILGCLVSIEWLGSKVLSEQNISNTLGSRDYSLFSPGNLLKELTNLKRELTNEINQLMAFYYYTN